MPLKQINVSERAIAAKYHDIGECLLWRWTITCKEYAKLSIANCDWQQIIKRDLVRKSLLIKWWDMIDYFCKIDSWTLTNSMIWLQKGKNSGCGGDLKCPDVHYIYLRERKECSLLFLLQALLENSKNLGSHLQEK